MLLRIAGVLLTAAALSGAQEPASADSIVAQAVSQAATSQRAVWVLFHASW